MITVCVAKGIIFHGSEIFFFHLERSNLSCETVPSAVDIIIRVSGVPVFQESYISESLPSERGSVYSEGRDFHNSVLK